MDLRQLRFFAEVARLESFTKAAESLHIAQPAVSIAIRNLEAGLGVTLLNRQGKKVTLTAEGEAFLGHAREILARMLAAEREMQERRGLEKGEVRVGIPTQLGSYYFPRIFVDFKKRYPQLRFSVYEYGTRRIGELLAQGALELGVIVTQDAPENLEVHPFLQEEMVACVPLEHPFAGQAAVRHEEFAREPLVLFEEGYFHREVVAQVSRHAGVSPTIIFETNLIPLLKSLVREGFGITTFLRMVTHGDPDLAAVPFTPPISFELGIAWKKNTFLSQANRAFADFLLDRTRSWQEKAK